MTITSEKIQRNVVENMTEGVIVIGFDGTILYANPAAFSILHLSETDLVGKKFAAIFFDNPENDAFTQTVLDAAYDRRQPHEAVVCYHTDESKKHLHMITSFLQENGKTAGVTMVFEDLSELMELRDSVKTLDHINSLNRQLNDRNRLLSKTFGLFLSDEIVRELLDTPGGLALGGRKRNVTIMMSDLRGFTGMSEQMDPGDLITMLNHYLGEMTGVIQGRGGTIIEFIGDGIMAIFGAPVSSDTHAADAVAAALEMQKAMDGINRWNSLQGFPRLEMGIALNTGEVIIGNIGSEKRMKYGVVGKHVNLCGRIESYTVGGQILISPDVRRSVQADLRIETEMTVFPKGADGEVVLSHVTGIGAPYDVYVSLQNDAQTKLKNPVPVAFLRINEKHTIGKVYYGGITSAGRDSAILETQTRLELFDNIQIRAGGRLLCKVTEQKEESYFLQYTSIPSEYDAWFKGITNQGTVL